MSESREFDRATLLRHDPYLEPFMHNIEERHRHFRHLREQVTDGGKTPLLEFARGFDSFGLHYRPEKGGVEYHEWAPGAQAIAVIGDFNGWDRNAHVCRKDDFGHFRVLIPSKADGSCPIPHGSKIKVAVQLSNGSWEDRLPAWIRYTGQNMEESTSLYGVFWNPPDAERHQWKYKRMGWSAEAQPEVPQRGAGRSRDAAREDDVAAEAEVAPRAGGPTVPSIKIYEAHVGMATERYGVGTYREFADGVLPRIQKLGYNCVQLMAVMEHAYYGSFGYHVTNFFAVAHRSGTPEDFKYLVDKAHSMGIRVIMDIVHSHASKNVLDGLNMWDGTDHHYFHGGSKGQHPLWDSRVFDYNKYEVLRFLLSNVLFFVNEFRVDGYRFDGVTSMLYHHHGSGFGFSGDYHEYFGDSSNVDHDAVAYLMLANEVLHTLSPPCISIAEDVSGMPTLGLPVHEGGLGFDFRLAMALPDMWIKLLKEVKDDDWNIAHIVHTLLNRRFSEGTLAYAESHDQALVGDKTLAFWLMDKDMYDNMSLIQSPTDAVSRGIALHKMIRWITQALGGDGWLNFMGNEFGHPEWIDFPREGNGYSYHYCRRQWSLVDDPLLRYKQLNAFDMAMQTTEARFPWLSSKESYVSLKHEEDKLLVFEKAGLVFVFNFHPSKSFADYRIGVPAPGDYVVALSTDDEELGGFNRVDKGTRHIASDQPWNGRPASMQVYAPSRTAVAYRRL